MHGRGSGGFLELGRPVVWMLSLGADPLSEPGRKRSTGLFIHRRCPIARRSCPSARRRCPYAATRRVRRELYDLQALFLAAFRMGFREPALRRPQRTLSYRVLPPSFTLRHGADDLIPNSVTSKTCPPNETLLLLLRIAKQRPWLIQTVSSDLRRVISGLSDRKEGWTHL